MKICLILEGSYPYVFGGVATWVNQYIISKPEHEFILITISATKKDKGKFVYKIPKNVSKIYEIFLDDERESILLHYKYPKEFVQQINNLILGKETNWDIIFSEVSKDNWNENHFFKSHEYLEIIRNITDNYMKVEGFTDVFFGMQSMLKPMLKLISIKVPKADIYHTTATGYAGIIGALARYKTKKPYIVTEHGIYPREREEEILTTNWLSESLKKTWIDFFYNLSKAAYKYATKVTSLFNAAMQTQQIIGCEKEKCIVIANGIDYDKYASMPLKEKDEYIDIGAFIRFSSIKDVKTLLYSFYELQIEYKNTKLHIFGATNDKVYKQECMNIIENLKMRNVYIYGQVNSSEYMQKIDFTILTSISEGQPLTVLESFAARRPVVCTNVGCCKELINGTKDDNYGKAGFCCIPMDISGIAEAMKKLCQDESLRMAMGENGQKRVKNNYTFETMMKKYFDVYEKEIKKWQE